ncbi:MAG: hypothetical protein JXB23_11285 [Candidatus Aminicenantes bacterium]|nr:hypothetical protein [Candidatus Aminicenantes bacterium]
MNRLIREGKLKREEADISFVQSLLDAAKRNFEAASIIEGKIDEAAFKLFYDGLLQIGRVILILNGYRPENGEQHKTTFAVAGEFLGNEYTILIRKIQKYRVKRNFCIYDPKIIVSRKETENIHRTAQEFWRVVRLYLSDKDQQLKLFRVH